MLCGMARTKEFNPDNALNVAMEIFWQRGYEATSVQDLCVQMGINKGSFYNTFGSKRALFLAALDRYVKLHEPAPDLVESLGSAKEAIAQIFYDIRELSIADVNCHGCMMVNTIVELAPHDAEIATLSEANRKDYEDTFYHLLSIAREMEEVSAKLDLRATARFLTNAMYGLRVTAKTVRDRAILEDIVNTTLSVLH